MQLIDSERREREDRGRDVWGDLGSGCGGMWSGIGPVNVVMLEPVVGPDCSRDLLGPGTPCHRAREREPDSNG